MTIYIDVLLAVNLYINYFLIRGTALILRREISFRRCLIASATGAVFSLLLVVPQIPIFVSILIKIICCIVTVLTAFDAHNTADFMFALLCFTTVSFTYAGLMLALWAFAAPFGMLYRNGVVYFDVPLIVVASITILGYMIVRTVKYLRDKRNLSAISANIEITVGDKTIQLIGIADTGNCACDPFSGKSVVICSAEGIIDIIPENIKNYLNGNIADVESIRLVPCTTIAGHTLVPVFKADLKINGKNPDAVIGVVKMQLGADCIFNPRLIT